MWEVPSGRKLSIARHRLIKHKKDPLFDYKTSGKYNQVTAWGSSRSSEWASSAVSNNRHAQYLNCRLTPFSSTSTTTTTICHFSRLWQRQSFLLSRPLLFLIRLVIHVQLQAPPPPRSAQIHACPPFAVQAKTLQWPFSQCTATKGSTYRARPRSWCWTVLPAQSGIPHQRATASWWPSQIPRP